MGDAFFGAYFLLAEMIKMGARKINTDFSRGSNFRKKGPFSSDT